MRQCAAVASISRLPGSPLQSATASRSVLQNWTIIDTAGGHKHYAAREQRSDAANALALAPRVVVTYDRNERTMGVLEDHGVTCIGIDDSELVRGLGGPRCMSMPLRRSSNTTC